MILNIQDDILKLHSMGLLDKLLLDKTTGKHIMWATDAYSALGSRYSRNEEITPELITGPNAFVIKTRARKELEQQSSRTRQHGEVSTPLWVCRKMCGYVDEMWDCKARWQKYVDARVLEITCGEAPFLVSRYDVETGEVIPVLDRIGLLDRKLRIVNENTQTEEDWLKWVFRAFHATYGYEFQGDNLLIARVNLLMTFEEYLWERWRRKPTLSEYGKLITVIVWNVWQMDGLHGTIPYSTAEEEFRQFNLFEFLDMVSGPDDENKQLRCRVYNWLGGGSVEYSALPTRGKRAMKFDFVIGNPPYQESDGGSGASATPVYNKFIDAVKNMKPDVISLIIPAKWYSGGKGLNTFREQMLSDKRIAVLVDYSNSLDVFPNVDVAGGVCYFIWDKTHSGKCKYTNYRNGIETSEYRDLDEFDTFIRYPIAASIVKKVRAKQEATLDQVVSSRKPFGLATNIKPLESGDIKLRFNGGIGLYKRDLISVGTDDISKYKIIISYLTAEHAGQPDKNGQYRILSTMEKLPPDTICTETYLVAGAFDSESEANHYMRYLKTKFVRFLVSLKAMTQHISKAMFNFVPVQDFSKTWTDSELFEKYESTVYKGLHRVGI